MYGYKNGKKVFSIPVEYTVTEMVDIRADENNNLDTDDILKNLESYGYTERDAGEHDTVKELKKYYV